MVLSVFVTIILLPSLLQGCFASENIGCCNSNKSSMIATVVSDLERVLQRLLVFRNNMLSSYFRPDLESIYTHLKYVLNKSHVWRHWRPILHEHKSSKVFKAVRCLSCADYRHLLNLKSTRSDKSDDIVDESHDLPSSNNTLIPLSNAFMARMFFKFLQFNARLILHKFGPELTREYLKYGFPGYILEYRKSYLDLIPLTKEQKHELECEKYKIIVDRSFLNLKRFHAPGDIVARYKKVKCNAESSSRSDNAGHRESQNDLLSADNDALSACNLLQHMRYFNFIHSEMLLVIETIKDFCGQSPQGQFFSWIVIPECCDCKSYDQHADNLLFQYQEDALETKKYFSSSTLFTGLHWAMFFCLNKHRLLPAKFSNDFSLESYIIDFFHPNAIDWLLNRYENTGKVASLRQVMPVSSFQMLNLSLFAKEKGKEPDEIFWSPRVSRGAILEPSELVVNHSYGVQLVSKSRHLFVIDREPMFMCGLFFDVQEMHRQVWQLNDVDFILSRHVFMRHLLLYEVKKHNTQDIDEDEDFKDWNYLNPAILTDVSLTNSIQDLMYKLNTPECQCGGFIRYNAHEVCTKKSNSMLVTVLEYSIVAPTDLFGFLLNNHAVNQPANFQPFMSTYHGFVWAIGNQNDQIENRYFEKGEALVFGKKIPESPITSLTIHINQEETH